MTNFFILNSEVNKMFKKVEIEVIKFNSLNAVAGSGGGTGGAGGLEEPEES